MSERDLIDELLQAKVKTKLFGGTHAPRLGRLVILEPLGSGGMGTVFCAYDPRLDRKVAVKLLRGSSASNARVLREARALGKLNHPNVVAVYDATETDGAISIVMELAAGESLRSWIGGKKPWRDVVGVMQQVGEGLSAAHRAGIVHRDVKPDNIVIGPDRTRLVDFGLASQGPPEPTPSPTGNETASVDSLEGSGTPAYMAPEVLAGAPASQASDQYAFGVTLAEALEGEKLPSWLGLAVARATAEDPALRFPSMQALLAELGHERRRKRQGLVAALAAVALAALVAVVSYQRGASRDLCGDGRARVTATWPAASVEKLYVSLGDAPWAKKSADDIVALVSGWERSHRRVCEATRTHGGQPESLLELRMRCLDRRFERMNALGAALTAGPLDPEARESVSAAIAALPRPERCESLVDLSELAVPDDPEQRARVKKGEKDLDRAWAAYVLGRYADAQKIAQAIEDVPFPPFRAALLLLLGSVDARLGTAEAARPRLQAALREASAAHAPLIELEIWLRLLRSELFDGTPARVIEWAPFARAAAARAGAQGAELDGIEAEARRDAGELGEARKLLTRALSSSDELRGDQRALIEMNLGSVELASQNPVAAEAAFKRALSLAEAALGKAHPGLGLYLDKLALSARDRGRIADALGLHERALELRRQVYGESDRSVATTLLRRAHTRVEAGKLAAAEADLARAHEIRVRIHGASHRRLGEIELARGDASAARGDRKKAKELYQRAAELDRTLDVASRLAALQESFDAAEAERRLTDWRGRGGGVSAAFSNQVALAQQRSGRPERAAQVYEAALGALADEPSRTRLRALVGLAECADGARARTAAFAALSLLDAMPELDSSGRPRLERIAKP